MEKEIEIGGSDQLASSILGVLKLLGSCRSGVA